MTDEQKRALEVLENVCTDDCVNKAFVVEPIKQLIHTQQEEIEDLKWKNKIYVKSIKSHKSEIEKKDTLIYTMQAEFERLEDLEDNTDMLKLELQKKDKIIDEMANFIEVFELDSEIAKTYCGETIKKCKHIDEDGCTSCIKEYFINKVEKGK